MKIDMTKFTEAFRTLPEGIDAAEAVGKILDDISISVSKGTLSDCRAYTNTNLAVFASCEGSVSRADSNDLDDDPVELMKMAADAAKYFKSEKKIEKGPQVYREAEPDDPSFDEMQAKALLIEKTLVESPQMKDLSYCSLRRKEISYHMVNSEGADCEYSDIQYTVDVNATLTVNGVTKDMGTSIIADKLEDVSAEALLDKLILNASLSFTDLPLMKPNFESCNVVWGAQIAAMMMVTSIRSVIGNHTKANVVYPFHPESIITYEKTVPETWGNVTRPYEVPEAYENGSWTVPVNKRTGVKMTSDAIKTYIAPQDNPLRSLVEEIGTGVFVTNSYDIIHSIASNGDFAIFADGIVYENGAPVGRFEHSIISGTMQQFMRNAEKTADDLALSEFMNPNYQYGSASIFVSGVTVVS